MPAGSTLDSPETRLKTSARRAWLVTTSASSTPASACVITARNRPTACSSSASTCSAALPKRQGHTHGVSALRWAKQLRLTACRLRQRPLKSAGTTPAGPLLAAHHGRQDAQAGRQLVGSAAQALGLLSQQRQFPCLQPDQSRLVSSRALRGMHATVVYGTQVATTHFMDVQSGYRCGQDVQQVSAQPLRPAPGQHSAAVNRLVASAAQAPRA